MRRATFLALACLLGVGILSLPGCGRQPAAPAPDATPRPVDSPATLSAVDPPATLSADGAQTAAGCRLSMGWDPWPPFHFIDHGGELTGFDVEIVAMLADDLGCELEFVRDSWVKLLAGIKGGTISLVTGATMTPERQQYAYFSSPVRLEQFTLFIRAGEEARWSGMGMADLMEQEMRLGITEAYDYGPNINAVLEDERFSGQVLRARFGEANVSRLMELEIDGFLEDSHAARAMIRRLGLKSDVLAHPMGSVSESEVRVMLSRKAVPEELVSRFDNSLARMKESGAYAAIEAKYFD